MERQVFILRQWKTPLESLDIVLNCPNGELWLLFLRNAADAFQESVKKLKEAKCLRMKLQMSIFICTKSWRGGKK